MNEYHDIYNPDEPKSPLSPTKPEDKANETVVAPPTVYSTGGHVHQWAESDEGHPDGHMTAICSVCGSGITYYPEVHGVLEGKLINKNE